MRFLIGLSTALAVAACGEAPQRSAEPASAPSPVTAVEYPLVEPIPPGQPGGLPDDRRPISEAPYEPTSPQGAANQMQIYFTLIGEKKFDQAWALWSGEPTEDANASGLTQAGFLADMNRYYQYSAQVGAPGVPEGAAGSIFITVPVQIYGRLKTGEVFHHRGDATLRRVNDVDASTDRQRQWQISGIATTPFP